MCCSFFDRQNNTSSRYAMGKLEIMLAGNTVIRRILIAVTIVLFGWIDLATGYEFSFALLYLLPVFMAAWFDTKIIATITIFASVLTWLYADFGSGHVYTYSVVPYWNATVRVIFFSVVAFLLFKVRESLATMTLMAMKDNLTSLNNSHAFDLEYQHIRRNKIKSDQKIAIGIIDLDGFKHVNDSLGHSKGDNVLIEFAQLLNSSTRNTDTVARMGGDEFVVILKDTDFSGAHDYSERLRQVFAKSGLRQRFGIDFSMGMSLFDDLPENLDDAKHLADQLMYQSKMLGKSQTIIRAV